MRSIVIFLLACTCLVRADEWSEERIAAQHKANHAAALNWHAALAAEEHLLQLPGVIANRKTKTVRILAESTMVTAGEPLEFVLITAASGHDYESLAMSYALPDDVTKAMAFIGLKPGRPIDYEGLHFFPRGPRVNVELEWTNATGEKQCVSYSQLIKTRESGRVLPHSDVMYTGGSGSAPGSIISLYNEPLTLFDVPRVAPQGDVYGEQELNVVLRIPPYQLVELRLSARYADGKLRQLDRVVRMQQGKASTAFVVEDPDGGQLLKGNFAALLAYFEKGISHGYDYYLTIIPDADMSLVELRKYYELFRRFDREGVLHLDPVKGQLFYQALLPDEQYRKREDRYTQPWELRLTLGADKLLHGNLARIEELYNDEGERTLRCSRWDVDNAEAVKKRVGQFPEGVGNGLFVLVDADIKYGLLQNYLADLSAFFPGIFVYFTEK